MRLKIRFINISSSESSSFILPISSKIVNFYDLHQLLLDKFLLKNKRLQFTLHDNFNIILSSQIQEVILDEEKDILLVEILDSKKRTNQELLQEFEKEEGYLKKKQPKNCDFCNFIERCSEIKEVFCGKKEEDRDFIEDYENCNNNEEKPHKFKKDIEKIQNYQIKENENAKKSANIKNDVEKIQTSKIKNHENIEKSSNLKKDNEQIQNFKIKNHENTDKSLNFKKNIEPIQNLKKDNNQIINLKKNEPLNKPIFVPSKAIIKKISDSSSESSDSDGKDREKKKDIPKSFETNAVILKKAADNVQGLNILTPEEEFARKKAQWKAIPVSSKKVNSKDYFKPISKDFLLKFYETHENKLFFQPNDIIRYKVFELCPTNLSPRLSDFYIGTIIKILDNTNFFEIKLRNSGEIIEIDPKTMIETGIDLSEMENTRKKELLDFENIEKLGKNIENTKENINKSNINNANNKKEYSKEDFIAKQVNYYFSDKNYLRDDFIQAHVRKSEDKYFPIRLLLNFPKIKQVTQDFNWLLEVLKDFQMKNAETCTFEFGVGEEGTIRKKITQ